MLTLAVDTTADYGSIALANERGSFDEILLHAPQGFSHVLFGEIEALLGRNGLALNDIELFAGASGPGSFTGVRVGLSAVKGLAEVMEKRVAAVSNLRALAEFGTADVRATVIDAHRGEIYGAVYDAQLNLVQEERVAPRALWWSEVPEGAEEIAQTEPLAQAIAAIAWKKFSRGEAQDPAEIDANYVRRSDAEMMWRDRA